MCIGLRRLVTSPDIERFLRDRQHFLGVIVPPWPPPARAGTELA